MNKYSEERNPQNIQKKSENNYRKGFFACCISQIMSTNSISAGISRPEGRIPAGSRALDFQCSSLSIPKFGFRKSFYAAELNLYEWKFLFVDDMSLESIEDRVLLNSVRFLIEKLLKSPASQPLNLNSTTRRILWKVFPPFLKCKFQRTEWEI